MQYRREIDGLRALAVVPVILFHAGFPWFEGGFVGVDVFFVISGYLITTLILEDIRSGKFSIVGFYERRTRRIIPALFIVLIFTVPFAWLEMSPGALADYSKSLVSVPLFISNFHFWNESGYFDTISTLKPLIHTWTLGVEEQFYIFFPLILLVFARLSRRWLLPVLASATLLSFVMAQWVWRDYEAARFFLIPARAWELFVGSICSIALLDRRAQSDRYGVLPFIGLLSVGAAVIFYDARTPFPGIYALLPVFGTATIILTAVRGTVVGDILSCRLLVAIGLLSYSAYLWHQPLFAFARIMSLDEPPLIGFAFLSVVAFGLAFLSWRFIECPFRSRNFLIRSHLFIIASGVGAVLVLVGLVGAYTFDGRVVSRKIEAIYGPVKPLKFSGLKDRLGENCSARPISELCVFRFDGNNTRWVVVGDSHARVLTEPLYRYVKETGGELTDMSASSCPFVPGFGVTIKGQPEILCSIGYNNQRLQYLLARPPSNIVVQSRLPFYLGLGPLDNGKGDVENDYDFLLDSGTQLSTSQRIHEVGDAMFKAYGKLIQAGHTLVLVEPVPAFVSNTVVRIDKLFRRGYGPKEIEAANAIGYDGVIERQKAVRQMLGRLKNAYRDKVVLVDSSAIFCDSFLRGACVSSDESTIFYADGDHLSDRGNEMLLKRILGRLGLSNAPAK